MILYYFIFILFIFLLYVSVLFSSFKALAVVYSLNMLFCIFEYTLISIYLLCNKEMCTLLCQV